ncbi:MAG: hypothetical protein K8F91_18590, partial [Candidatus Obscuribacterales bacterium]|nr:hypothetical protein [Candidatus Obscuribacterales bacterium]
MSGDTDKSKVSDQVKESKADKPALDNADADSARTASKKVVDAVEDTRTNKSSGSLGFDRGMKVPAFELVEDESVVASRDIDSKKNKPEVEVENQVKSNKLVDVDPEILNTGAITALAGSDPLAAAGKQMLESTSDPKHRAGIKRDITDLLKPESTHEQLEQESKGYQANLIGSDMTGETRAETFSLADIRKLQESHAQQVVEKTGDKYTLKIDVRENVIIGDTAESDSDQQNLRNATRAILDTAKERFGKDDIEQLGIASDDVGSAITALLLGADLFKSMGPVEARNFGNRLMVFGLAPLFGMAQEAHKEIVENTSETIKEGQVNFLAGTGLGILLERAHPLLLAGLTIGFTGQFVTDQFCSPENVQRNTEIIDISSTLDNVGSDDLARYCRRSKELLGPGLFKGAFGIATGGIGIPKGQIIAAETKVETAAIGAKIKAGDVLENLSQLPREACDALAWLFSRDGGPKLAWAHSVHGEMPAQKHALDSTDNLAMADGRYFEWIKYLGKPALNPNLKLSEAVEMAIERMVKPPKDNLKKLSEKFPDTKELADHLKDRQEHSDSLTRVLSQLSEPRDL